MYTTKQAADWQDKKQSLQIFLFKNCSTRDLFAQYPYCMSASEEYKKAGVDTEEGRWFAEKIKEIARSTFIPGILGSRTGFAGMLDAGFLKSFRNPVILTTTDGVGTKLHLARLFDRHSTVGIDLVGMVANDILATGGKSYLFLDYIACGRLDRPKMLLIGESIAAGCRLANAALAGGETAEHPGIMEDDEYDLAGFMVGAVEKDELIDGQNISAGDVILSLPSSGIHSNGLSLIRRIYLKNGTGLPDSEEDKDFLLNQILLQPTVIYEPVLRPLLDSDIRVNGVVHITGGGFFENIPRVLPDHLMAEIDQASLTVPEVFRKIQEKSGMNLQEMYSVLNMGTGMAVIVRAEHSSEALHILRHALKTSYPSLKGEVSVIGRIAEKTGDTPVRFV